MRITTLVAFLCAAVLHSQTAPASSPTPPIKNYAKGWLDVVSCERDSGGNWALTLKNVSNGPIGYIVVSARDALNRTGQEANFLGATLTGPTTPQDTFHVKVEEGLAPGATYTFRLGELRQYREWLLTAMSPDGGLAGLWVDGAATLGGWLGESIENRNIYELVKVIATNDSDETIDAVIEGIKALEDKPPLTIDGRIERLVAEPSLGQDGGRVQFAFYCGMTNAKDSAVHQLMEAKKLKAESRHKLTQVVPQLFLAKIDAVSAAISKLP